MSGVENNGFEHSEGSLEVIKLHTISHSHELIDKQHKTIKNNLKVK